MNKDYKVYFDVEGVLQKGRMLSNLSMEDNKAIFLCQQKKVRSLEEAKLEQGRYGIKIQNKHNDGTHTFTVFSEEQVPGRKLLSKKHIHLFLIDDNQQSIFSLLTFLDIPPDERSPEGERPVGGVQKDS